jgi:pyridoxamine 5'-phosphate oxidase
VSQLSDLRRDYALAALTEGEVDPDPVRQFRQWYTEADAANLAIEPNAMTLATATADGTPSARMVLLRGFDEHGFVFFTDYRSRKGEELAANARAALVFYWAELERQVRITGAVVQVTAEESDAYFRTRPALSQLSALASHQSQAIANREVLERRVEELRHQHSGSAVVPRPAYWGGFRVRPLEIEFWQGRPNRLHDRVRYRRDAVDTSPWRIDRLSP